MIVSDYLSLWEVAHRWHGVDPNKTDASDLPLAVQDALRYLCGAVLSGDVPLYISDAIDASDGNGHYFREIRYYAVEELPPALQSCAFARKYDKSILDDHLISRHNLFERSIWEHGQFPDFWEDEKLITDLGGVFREPTAQEVPKPPSPNSSLFDQSLCQAIAKTLWDIYPNMTIEAMTKHPSILKFGNGGLYKGKNTLRDWLSPVAPENVKKPGRPKKAETQ
ncbi:MAG: hypothetical protein WBZ31_12230 [Thiobacillus sp.]